MKLHAVRVTGKNGDETPAYFEHSGDALEWAKAHRPGRFHVEPCEVEIAPAAEPNAKPADSCGASHHAPKPPEVYECPS